MSVDKSTHNEFLIDDQHLMAAPTQRRSFLKALGGGVLGATVVAAGVGVVEPAQGKEGDLPPLWNSAFVLIGNSLADQVPSPIIECPMFFPNGVYANASHGLDLSNLDPQTGTGVIGTLTIGGQTIAPNFDHSIAAAPVIGSDAVSYVLVGGEGTVVGGTGQLNGVTDAIIRCKYKVSPTNPFLLIACVYCVIMMVRK